MDLLAGVNHVAVLTADLDRFVEFYTDVFDLEVVFAETTPAFRHAIVRTGPTSWLHPAEVAGNDHAAASPTMFDRGHLDHLALTAASPETFARDPRPPRRPRRHRRHDRGPRRLPQRLVRRPRRHARRGRGHRRPRPPGHPRPSPTGAGLRGAGAFSRSRCSMSFVNAHAAAASHTSSGVPSKRWMLVAVVSPTLVAMKTTPGPTPSTAWSPATPVVATATGTSRSRATPSAISAAASADSTEGRGRAGATAWRAPGRRPGRRRTRPRLPPPPRGPGRRGRPCTTRHTRLFGRRAARLPGTQGRRSTCNASFGGPVVPTSRPAITSGRCDRERAANLAVSPRERQRRTSGAPSEESIRLAGATVQERPWDKEGAPMEVQPKKPSVKGPVEWFTGDVWIDAIARPQGNRACRSARCTSRRAHGLPGTRTASARSCTSSKARGSFSPVTSRSCRSGRATSSTRPPTNGTGTAPPPTTS